MKLIIGLGNPGKRYLKTRHNLGFLIIDELRKKLDLPAWKSSKKFFGKTSQNKEVILLKPSTFMNSSGKAAKAVASFYNIKEVWAIHDDVDLISGKIKIVKNRGSAGHKGVESIMQELKTKDFTRFRIGIGQEKKCKAEKFVLKKITKEEEKVIHKAAQLIYEACHS